MVTPASQWKKKNKTGHHELDLPSGNTCLVRAIKPEAFLENGMIPSPLMAIVQQSINSKKGLPPSKVNEIANDPVKLASAMEMFDRVLVYAVIEPAVELPPVCEDCGELETGGKGIHVDRKHEKYHRFNEPERDEEILYADEVDLEDKQFIFQFCVGGTADVASFRKELKSTVDAVQTS